jgi:hypothetical protein
MAQGLSSISLNPDTGVDTWQRLGRVEVHAPAKTGVPVPRLLPMPAARVPPKVLTGHATR